MSDNTNPPDGQSRDNFFTSQGPLASPMKTAMPVSPPLQAPRSSRLPLAFHVTVPYSTLNSELVTLLYVRDKDTSFENGS